jgi:divalent metal cation (Fe/Co/Zn/Cd) transporter
MVTSVWIVYEAVHRIVIGEHAVVTSGWAVAVILASIVVDFYRARALHRIAAKTRSQALEADALHFSSDMLSSAVVLVGLCLVWLGYPLFDAIAAILVAVFVALAGCRLGVRTVDALIDAAPEGAVARIRATVEPIDGVFAVNRLRARPVGPALFVDVEIGVVRTLPLDQVNEIKNAIADAVNAEFTEAEVNVVATPIALTNETVGQRVQLIAARSGLPVHHITVQQVNGRLSVSFDVELDRGMTLGDAHALASKLERDIGDEMGGDVEVESHIEPLHISSVEGEDAPAELAARIAADLTELAMEGGKLGAVYAVRARSNEHGLFVTFRCGVSPQCTVEAVHDAVDGVETSFRRRWPKVRRVVAHAEPWPAESCADLSAGYPASPLQ